MKPRLVLLSLLFAASAEALNLVVPAAGPLVITTSEAEPVPVMITFYGPEGRRGVETILVAGSATVDVPATATLIRITSAQPVTAHAASLRAVAIDALPAESVMSGVVRIANPWFVPASVVVTLPGEQRFHLVPPLDVLQLEVSANARITSNVGVYAYDERTFVADAGQPSAIEPRCTEPAALDAAQPGPPSADGWLVLMNPGTPVDTTQMLLPARHGYMPLSFHEELPGFIAELTPEQIAALRCESSVQLIARNAVH